MTDFLFGGDLDYVDFDLHFDSLTGNWTQEDESEPYVWILFVLVTGPDVKVRVDPTFADPAHTDFGDVTGYEVSFVGQPRVVLLPDPAHAFPNDLPPNTPLWIPPEFGRIQDTLKPLPVEIRPYDPNSDVPVPAQLPAVLGGAVAFFEEDSLAPSVRLKLHDTFGLLAAQKLGEVFKGQKFALDVPTTGVKDAKVPPEQIKELNDKIKAVGDEIAPTLKSAAVKLVLAESNFNAVIDADDFIGSDSFDFDQQFIRSYTGKPFVFTRQVVGSDQWTITGNLRCTGAPSKPPPAPKSLDLETPGAPHWDRLDVSASSDPAIVGSVLAYDLFYLDQDRALAWNRVESGKLIDGGMPAAPTLTSAPAVAVGTDAIDLVARGRGQDYLFTSVEQGRSSEWRSLGGKFRSAPTAVRTSEGLFVFGRGLDDALWGASVLPEGEARWHRLGGTVGHGASAIPSGNGVRVFAVDDTGAIHQLELVAPEEGGTWTPRSDGAVLASAPTAVTTSQGTELLGRGLDDALWLTAGGWIRHGGKIKSRPAAVTGGTKETVVLAIARGQDSALWTTARVYSTHF